MSKNLTAITSIMSSQVMSWLFTLIIIFAFTFRVSAQNFTVKGIVIDKNTSEALAFCNIYAPQANLGFTSDEDGKFELSLPEHIDSLVFYYLGYKNEVIKERKILRRADSLVVKMEPAFKDLEEVVVLAPKKRRKDKDTIAWRIFKNVVANKDQNKEKVFKSLQYEEYVKTVASLYNVNPNIAKRKIVRPFRFVFENQDTTLYGNKFIPLILKEVLNDHFYHDDPDVSKVITRASKVSGMEQLRFSELLDVVFDEMDVYDNQLILSGKGFMLPFADGAWFNYKYFLIDSTENDSCEWIYQIAFAPKVKGDLAFTGYAWIHEPTYAIQKIKLELDNRANINWYNEFYLEQEFTYFKDKGWVKKQEKRTTSIAFTKRKKSKSIHLLQFKDRNQIKVNEALPDTALIHSGMYAKGYDKKDTSFWSTNRHTPLSKAEFSVYGLIDSLKNTRAYKNYSTIGRLLTSGYYRAGPIDIGCLANMVSYNDVEGVRLRFQTRSNWKLSQNFRYMVYGAYGIDDKRFKFGINTRYRIPNKNKFANDVGIIYKDDYQRFSLDNSQYEYDFILNTFLRRRGFDDLVYMKDFSAFYRKQWVRDFTTEFQFNWRQYNTIPGKVEFKKTMDDGTVVEYKEFQVFAPKISLTYTPGSRFLQTETRNIYLKGNMPRFFLDYSFSKKGWLGSDFNYQKLELTMEHRLAGPVGYTKYVIYATKLFGSVPYPLLFIHPGNENFILDWRRFANMKEAEYGADQQVSLLLEHHFDGFFFNKIPLLKKLKWREVLIARMALSSLDKKKISFTDVPDRIKGLDGFYAETGFGIENIFKMGKIQFTWRHTQKDKPDFERFRIRIAVNPDF